MEDNKLIATNSTRVGIDNLTTNTSAIILRGNVLTKATINRTGKEVIANNILDGVVDPYFKMTSAPTSLYYSLGQTLFNSAPASAGYLGWVCTTAGIANNTAWTTGTSYVLNALVNSNGNVYQCIIAGTAGATAPTGTGASISDGGATWKYISPLAVFKQYGLIQ
jgi:hypothetical protein